MIFKIDRSRHVAKPTKGWEDLIKFVYPEKTPPDVTRATSAMIVNEKKINGNTMSQVKYLTTCMYSSLKGDSNWT